METLGLGLVLSFQDNASHHLHGIIGLLNQFRIALRDVGTVASGTTVQGLNRIANATGLVGVAISALGVTATGVFKNMVIEVTKVGMEMEGMLTALDQMLGSKPKAMSRLLDFEQVAARTPLTFKDVANMGTQLTVVGLDPMKKYEGTWKSARKRADGRQEGTYSRTLLEALGDLVAMRPDKGVGTAIREGKEFVEGNSRPLKMSYGLSTTEILNEKIAKTAEERADQLVKMLAAANIIGGMEKAGNNLQTILTNLKSDVELFISYMTLPKEAGAGGFIDYIKEPFKDLFEYMKEFTKQRNIMSTVGKSWAEGLKIVVAPAREIIKILSSLIKLALEFSLNHPKIVTFGIAFAGLASQILLFGGALLVATALFLKFRTWLFGTAGMMAYFKNVVGSAGKGLLIFARSFIPVAAAASFMYYAFRTNFLGIRSLIDSMTNRVGSFIDVLVEFMTNLEAKSGKWKVRRETFEIAKENGWLELINQIIMAERYVLLFWEGFKKGAEETQQAINKVNEAMVKLLTQIGLINEPKIDINGNIVNSAELNNGGILSQFGYTKNTNTSNEAVPDVVLSSPDENGKVSYDNLVRESKELGFNGNLSNDFFKVRERIQIRDEKVNTALQEMGIPTEQIPEYMQRNGLSKNDIVKQYDERNEKYNKALVGLGITDDKSYMQEKGVTKNDIIRDYEERQQKEQNYNTALKDMGIENGNKFMEETGLSKEQIIALNQQRQQSKPKKDSPVSGFTGVSPNSDAEVGSYENPLNFKNTPDFLGIKNAESTGASFAKLLIPLTLLIGGVHALRLAFKALSFVFSPVISGFKFLFGAVEGGQSRFSKFITFIGNIGNVLKKLGGTLFSPLKNALKGFGNFLLRIPEFLSKIPSALSKVFSPIGSIFSRIGSYISTFRNLGIKAMFQEIGTDIVSVFSKIKNVFLNSGIGRYVVGWVNTIKGGIGSIIERLVRAIPFIGNFVSAFIRRFMMIRRVSGVFTAIRYALTALRVFLASNPIGLALLAIGLAVEFIINHWEQFKNTADDVWNHITETLSEAWTSIKQAFEPAIKVLGELWDDFCRNFPEAAKVVLGILDFFNEKLTASDETAQTVFNAIGAVVKIVFDVIVFIITSAVGIISGGIQMLGGAFDILGGIFKLFQGDWEGGWALMQSGAEKFGNGIKTIIRTIGDAFFDLKDRILAAIGAMSDLEAASNIAGRAAQRTIESHGTGNVGASRSDFNALKGYSKGGYVTSATQAIIGEGGNPEYVIPMNNNPGSLDLMYSAMNDMAKINPKFNQSIKSYEIPKGYRHNFISNNNTSNNNTSNEIKPKEYRIFVNADNNVQTEADKIKTYIVPQVQGNIDLTNRTLVRNYEEGGYNTLRPIHFLDERDNLETLIPTVVEISKGIWKIVSDEDAIKYYYKTGQHLGKFKTSNEAISYANYLHKQQETFYREEIIKRITSEKQNRRSSEIYDTVQRFRGNIGERREGERTVIPEFTGIPALDNSREAVQMMGRTPISVTYPLSPTLKLESVEENVNTFNIKPSIWDNINGWFVRTRKAVTDWIEDIHSKASDEVGKIFGGENKKSLYDNRLPISTNTTNNDFSVRPFFDLFGEVFRSFNGDSKIPDKLGIPIPKNPASNILGNNLEEDTIEKYPELGGDKQPFEISNNIASVQPVSFRGVVATPSVPTGNANISPSRPINMNYSQNRNTSNGGDTFVFNEGSIVIQTSGQIDAEKLHNDLVLVSKKYRLSRKNQRLMTADDLRGVSV